MENPQKNGAGTLNHLKLVRVGKRLKEMKYLELDSEFQLKLLSDPGTYDFSSEIQNKSVALNLKIATDLNTDCQKRRVALDHLRTVFLLTEDRYAREALSYNFII